MNLNFLKANEAIEAKEATRTRGFTLIELLVVIAIIGILSGIVLASLNTARAKGADAAIKANLSGIRAQAELTYDDELCYNAGGAADCTFVTTGAVLCDNVAVHAEAVFKQANINAALIAAGNASNGTGLTRATCDQAADGGAWAVSVPLKTNSALHWCTDSTGTSKQTAAVIASTVCP